MSGLGAQTIEDFWGAELSSKQKKLEWNPEDDEDMEDVNIEQVLELRQACLGVSAKDGERNVVQVTAENEEGELVKHTILSLRAGGTEQCSLFLTLQPPVTFELVAGSGPLHIVGSSVESMTAFDDLDSSSDEDSLEDIEVSSPEVRALLKSKKRPAAFPSDKPAKQMRLDKSSGESTADTSMDTSGSVVPTRPSKKKPKKPVEEDDDDDDDDDEEEEEDDEDEDDEEDDEDEEEEEEESDEEEEEEEVKPPTKKPQSRANGKPKQKVNVKPRVFQTPQHTKPTKPTKGSVSAPTTPKQVEKKGSVKGAPNLDEAKKLLLKQLPNVPKKLEKFNNFVGNSLKIKDNSAKKQLWEFVQKNRA